MREPKVAPYGSWSSPITPDFVAKAGIGISHPVHEEGTVYWLESRPAEGGRNVVVLHRPQDEKMDVTPKEFNVRTAVHEYGGGAFTVHGGMIYFTNWIDQRLYRQVPGDVPRPITPEPEIERSVRYADCCVMPHGRYVICVRERHKADGDVVNEIVAIPTDGGTPRTLATGRDFYAAPRLSRKGKTIAWLEWDHPNMPWDGTSLMKARLTGDAKVSRIKRVAGGPKESVIEPRFSPRGVLCYLSDRNGFWNLYASGDTGDVCLHPTDADCGEPPWTFGSSSYCFLTDGRILLKEIRDGVHHLLLLDSTGKLIERLETDAVTFHDVTSGGDRGYVVAAGATWPPRLLLVDDSGAATVLADSLFTNLDPAWFSRARPIRYPTGRGETAHALFYPPANPEFTGPSDELPPLVVMSHGGPTSMTLPALSFGIQFFTSRGIAVVDVNYRGSTGYGRKYRDALKGKWGKADVEDCANAARFLAREGEVDGKRMAIRGGSAGGFTTLSALAFTDVFAAGVSRYGVADLEGLARDTHKFESRYLDGLVGSWPEHRDRYRERSPIHHTEGFSCPLLVMQGLEDEVVPPSQSEAIVAALAKRQIPHAYLTFEEEQHGFRKAENIRRALMAEVSFYGRVFGFAPAGEEEPITIEGL